MQYNWIYFHHVANYENSNMVHLFSHPVKMPVCKNAYAEFLRDFNRMNVRINGETCTDAIELKPVLRHIGLPRIQKQFLSSICQTSMSEPLLAMQKLFPDLICAECSFREPLDVNIYHDRFHKVIRTVSFKLRMVREQRFRLELKVLPEILRSWLNLDFERVRDSSLAR